MERTWFWNVQIGQSWPVKRRPRLLPRTLATGEFPPWGPPAQAVEHEVAESELKATSREMQPAA